MPENTVSGTNILQVTATDGDFGDDASLIYSKLGNAGETRLNLHLNCFLQKRRRCE